MGDFERTFGAGADADSIIDGFSEAADRCEDDEDHEILESGRDLPRAQSFYDLTGQVWHPGRDPRARLTAAQLSEIDALAQQVVDEFDEDADAQPGFNRSEVATLFLKYVRPGLIKIGPSLDAFEAFIGQIVRNSCVPMVFARDTGPEAGYVSRSLSMHIIAFPEEIYLARLGGLALEGPFSDFKSFGGYAVLHRDSYRRFAEEGPGREVLEISAELRDLSVPIRTARDWVDAENCDFKEVARGHNGFDTVASRALSRQQGSRTWSNATEDALRKRVRGIVACLAPEGANLEVSLYPNLSKPRLYFSAYGDGMAFDDAHEKLVTEILDRLNVSAFRDLVSRIQLLDERSFSAHERMSGVAVLLDTLAEWGLDASAASDALARADFAGLLQIVSPETYEEARRKKAEEPVPGEALARLGLREEDLPF